MTTRTDMLDNPRPHDVRPLKATRGLECPRCGCRHFRVIYTQPRNGFILRRRECRHCGRRVTTREQ